MRAVAIFQLDRCYLKMFMPARQNMYKVTIPSTVICLFGERMEARENISRKVPSGM